MLLTPIVDDPKRAILAYVSKPPVAEGTSIHFDIMILGVQELPDGDHFVQFQVSRFATTASRPV